MWLKQFRERKGPERGVAGWFTASQNGGCDPLQKKKKILFLFSKKKICQGGRLSGHCWFVPRPTDQEAGADFCCHRKAAHRPLQRTASRWASGQRVETFSNIFIWFPKKKTAIEGGASGTVLIAGPPTKRRLSQTDGFIDESPKNLNPPGSGFDHWPMAARRLFMSLFVFAQFACGANLGLIFEQKLYRN